MKISSKAKRELAMIVLLLVSILLVYSSVFGEGGYTQLLKHRDELHRLQFENARLRENHHDYLQKIRKLKSDPSEIERIARERYNFAQPGDIIVNLPGRSVSPTR